MLAIAWWMRSALIDDRDALAAFCQSTRGGEPWVRTLERGRARGFEFVQGNNSADRRQEFLAIVDRFGTGMACRITVEKGHVVATHADNVPR